MLPSQSAKPNLGGSVPQRKLLNAARSVTLVTLVVASVVIRFERLVSKPFWFDECFSVEMARIDWRNFLHLLWWREANMSLYYVLLKAWLHFGQSQFFIRSLSVIFAAAMVPAIYWVARTLYNAQVALIAAALFTSNAYSVRYAQEARSYSLFLLLATLSSGFLVAWLREPTRANWFGYVVASALAVYAHFYALLLVAAHWLALGGGGAFRAANQPELGTRELRRAWITIGAAVLPLLIFVAKTGAGPIKWIQRPGVRDIFNLFQNLAGSTNWPLLALLACACVAAIAPYAGSLLTRPQSWGVWRSHFLLVWLLFPVAFTVVLSFARPVFLARYMIFCMPPLLILAAAGIARLPLWWIRVLVLSGALVLSGQGIWFVYGHDFDDQRDASGAASDFILEHSAAGDGIIFHIAETRIPYEFFRSLRTGRNPASPEFNGQPGPEILFPRHGPGLDYRDFTGKPTEEFLRAAARSHTRLWVMLMHNGSADKPDSTTATLSRVLPESLPKIESWQFAKVEVRLYSKQ
jgi:mannosyltransferase